MYANIKLNLSEIEQNNFNVFWYIIFLLFEVLKIIKNYKPKDIELDLLIEQVKFNVFWFIIFFYIYLSLKIYNIDLYFFIKDF